MQLDEYSGSLFCTIQGEEFILLLENHGEEFILLLEIQGEEFILLLEIQDDSILLFLNSERELLMKIESNYLF